MAVPYKLNYFEIKTGIDATSTFVHSGDLTATKVKKYLATSNDILLGDGTTTSLSGLQPTGNYITALTGEATATGPGSVAITLTNSAVISKLLTGLSITGSTIAATDTILQAFGKVQNQINGKQGTITLTTTGTSGASTLIANTLNIPQYTDAFVGTVTSVAALTLGTTGTDLSSTVVNSTTTPVITLNVPTASATNRGALSAADWTTFNSKQNTITLTTTGSSGASTFISNTLNVPTYTLIGLGGVPTTRTITINGTSQDLSADRSYNVGTVTSVGLTMPAAFSIANSPVTGAGTIAITGAGLASQYIRGDGALADFPNTGGGGSSVSYYLNGSVNQGTFVGNTYYEMNKTPVIGTGTDFTIAANGYIAQFITDANDPASLLIPGGNWNVEMYFSASSNGGSPSFYVEVYKYNGTTFTLLGTSSATPEGITNGTAIDLYYTSVGIPETVLAITDRLAIRVYVTHSGRTITLHTEDNHLSEIVTTFSNGLTALNGLTKQAQYFATGTTGTDFNISSSVDTHTFNIPTASATNRGALSSANWTTFNAKESVLTFSSPLVRTVNTISIPVATTSVNGYLSSADWTTFNNKQGTITLTTTGTSGASTLIANTLNIPQYADAFVGTVTSVAAITLGTTGTDLSSTVANGTTTPVITLQVPTASASNRGALSSADWTTFNNKAAALSGTINTIAYWNSATTIASLALATYPSLTELSYVKGVTSAIQTQLNAKQDTITLTTTGTSGAATFIANTLNIPNYADGGVLSLSAIGAVPNANAATITGTVLNLQPADASFGGVVTTGIQTFAGAKTLSSTLASTFVGQFFENTGASTSAKLIRISNTSGDASLGVEGSTPTQIITAYGGVGYSTVLKTVSTTPLILGTNSKAGITIDGSTQIVTLAAGLSGQTANFTGQLTLGSTITNGTYTYTLPSATGTLALTSSLGSYVPYSGATGAVNLGAYNLTVNGVTVGIGTGSVGSNTAVGNGSLVSNTTGSSNTAIGIAALYSNTIGNSNSGYGASALTSTTIGLLNTSLGALSLYSNISGSQNTAVGYNAGGSGSGASNTTGDNNIFIGNNSIGVNGTESNRTWIGNEATTSTWLGGDLILGSTTDSGTDKLQVTGTSKFTGAITGTSATFSGSVGIGRASTALFDVYATSAAESLLQQNTAGSYARFTIANNSTGTLEAIMRGSTGAGGLGQTGSGDFIVRNGAMTLSTQGAFPIVIGPNSTTALTIASTGAATFSSSLTVSAARSAFFANSEPYSIQVKYSSATVRGYYIGSPSTGIMTFSNADGDERFRITDAGVVTITNLGTGTVQATAGVLSVISDSKAKDKTGLFEGSALSAIYKIEKPQYWNYNAKSELGESTYGVKQFGLFADDIHKVLGEEFAPTQTQSVYDEETKETTVEPILIDGSISYSMSDRALLSLAIQAIQELKAEIDLLKGIAPIEPIVPEVTTQTEPESEPIIPSDNNL